MDPTRSSKLTMTFTMTPSLLGDKSRLTVS